MGRGGVGVARAPPPLTPPLPPQVGTWGPARRFRSLHAGWALLGAGAGACLLRAAYWGCVRVSQPLPPRA